LGKSFFQAVAFERSGLGRESDVFRIPRDGIHGPTYYKLLQIEKPISRSGAGIFFSAAGPDGRTSLVFP